MSELGDKQRRFARSIAKLIIFGTEELAEELELDIQFTTGDFWRPDRRGHHPESTHYEKLAGDLNLFVNGKYIAAYDQAPEVWDRLGAFWKAQDVMARWGGDFGDFNHFSFEHQGVA